MNGGEKDAIDNFSTNKKTYDVLPGKVDFKVVKVDKESGEIGGTFLSVQPSDADMGSKVPTDIQISGKWFAKVAEGDAISSARYKNVLSGKGESIEKATSYGKQGVNKLMYAPNPASKK